MDGTQQIPLPEQLKEPAVPRPVLEEYVMARIRQFSSAFVQTLLGDAGAALPLDRAFQQTQLMLQGSDGNELQQELDSYHLRFTHRCKFLGCKNKDCILCINNPHKRCSDHDNFDECYADNQVLKSKCDADVYLELVCRPTGKPGGNLANAEVLVSVVDGDSVGSGAAIRYDHFRELCKSDEGACLLAAHMTGTKGDGFGRLVLKLQNGVCRLPDLYITDKNDTFHMNTHTYSTFRLMGRVVQRDLMGNPTMVVDNVTPAVSDKFIVKTQRALNDYRKNEYPHFKDELTKLKFIGSITAQRLRDIQAHIANVPFTSVETVEQLKHLMLFADQNRQVEAKLLEILNMKGKHKHKWDYLRQILLERIVYDDMVHRAWFSDEAMSQGLLFATKQGQVNIEKPFGIAQRTVQGSTSRLQVIPPTDTNSVELMKVWKAAAEEAWLQPGHPGWTVVTEPLELVSLTGSEAAQASMSTDSGPPQQGSRPKREATVSGPIGGNFPFHQASAAQADASSGPFQFTAQRAPSKAPSNTGTPRNDGLPPLLSKLAEASGASGPFNPFAQVARGQAQGTADPKAALSRNASPSSARPIPLISNADPARQASAPHPFAVMAHNQERQLEAQRVTSTPVALQSGPAQALIEAFRAANAAAHAQAHAQAHGLSLGAEAHYRGTGEGQASGSNTATGAAGGVPQLVRAPSRFRRLSAADAEHMGQYLQVVQAAAAVQAAAGEATADASTLPKRPRAVPTEAAVVDPILAQNLLDTLAKAGSTAALLYHQESLGRHIPRGRMSVETGQYIPSQPPAPAPPSSPFLPLEVTQPLLSADNILSGSLTQLLDPAAPDDRSASAAVLGSQPPMSPSHTLSACMQDSLHIGDGNGSSDLSTGAGPPAPASGPPASGTPPSTSDALLVSNSQGGIGGISFKPPPQLLMTNSESFNKTLNRLLNHSDSDSFRRMLDVAAFASPTGGQDQAAEFASFLESFATGNGQEQPSL